MSEERIERMEAMLGDLISMVGRTNAIAEELREDVADLKKGQKSLEEGQKSLEKRQKSLEEGQKSLEKRQKSLEEGQKSLEERQQSLEEGQNTLREELKLFRQEVNERFLALDNKLDFIKYKVSQNEEEIYLLKKAQNS